MRAHAPRLILLAALACACTQSPTGPLGVLGTPTPTAGAAPSPSPQPKPLLVAVEARSKAAHYGPLPGWGDSYDAVAIAGLDGFARARATFKPRQVPAIPGGGTALMPPPAVVAAGAVYYADAEGKIRRLTRSGGVEEVTTFPTAKGQEVWFAVSPDGKHLAATVLTVPATATGHWAADLETADAGGAATTVRHEDLGTSIPRPDLVVGWDQGGPVVALNSTVVAVKGATVRYRPYRGSAVAHLDAAGNHGPALGGASCDPWYSEPAGTILCAAARPSVRDPQGNVIWTAPPGAYVLQGHALSPDSRHLAAQPVLITDAGWAEKLPEGFVPEAWLDAEILAGQAGGGRGDAAYVVVGDAIKPHDLGFTGVILGGLPPA